MTGEKLSAIKDAHMEITYWSVRASSRKKEGTEYKVCGGGGGDRYL